MSVSATFSEVTKKFGDLTVIDRLNLHINPGEFFTLLGPSGCGKTTLLRMLAGFNSIEGGEVWVNKKVINHLPAHKRNMGMVFQSYAIFPHLSVTENIAYGLKARKVAASEIRSRVEEVLTTMQIAHLKDRLPKNLSGGQQQRVALARAIVINPEILLMDEPLSNLDAKLRVDMRLAIKRIQREVNITTIYVTHDQEEALAISDRIAVMNGGVIEQLDTPLQIYRNPETLFVASFIGTTNIFSATLTAGKLDFAGMNLSINLGDRVDAGYSGEVKVTVRPEELILENQIAAGKSTVSSKSHTNKETQKPTNGLAGRVELITYLGQFVQYQVRLSDGREIEYKQSVIDIPGSKSTRSEGVNLLQIGDEIVLGINKNTINVFDAKTERSLLQP